MIYYIQKGARIEDWITRTLQNNVLLLIFFVGREAFDPVYVGSPWWNFGLSDELIFFGVKSILPFSKLIIGKSQFFSARSYVRLHSYTHMGQIPQDGENGKMWHFFLFFWSSAVTTRFDFFYFSQLYWRNLNRAF